MARDERSVVQAYHEEMTAIFTVLKTARRLVAGDAQLSMLEMDLMDLDDLRATQRQSPARDTKT